MRILIIEPYDSNAEFLKKRLEELFPGVEVVIEKTVHRGLFLVGESAFDYVLVGHHPEHGLYESEGSRVARLIQTHYAPPVVVMTGKEDDLVLPFLLRLPSRPKDLAFPLIKTPQMLYRSIKRSGQPVSLPRRRHHRGRKR